MQQELAMWHGNIAEANLKEENWLNFRFRKNEESDSQDKGKTCMQNVPNGGEVQISKTKPK